MASMNQKTFHYIPDTISEQAKEYLSGLVPEDVPPFPEVGDLEGWRKLQQLIEEAYTPLSEKVLEAWDVEHFATELGGIPVRDIRPRGWTDNGKVLIHLHGGAYVAWSTRSTLCSSVPIAAESGFRVVSVEYTLAPFARYGQIMDESISVIQALQEAGCGLSNIGLFGESAGGSLAAAVTLKMRDAGLGMPAALALHSPWSDLTDDGDTYVTLRHADLMSYPMQLRSAAAAYAGEAEQRHPWLSPVYADYAAGFPPTLIQGGTKEIFLSNFIRHYQALDTAGQVVKLDLYEGMPHAFACEAPFLPESRLAQKKAARFLLDHLMAEVNV